MGQRSRGKREKKKKKNQQQRRKTKQKGRGKTKQNKTKHERKERREKNEKRKRLRGHSKYSLTTLQSWWLKPGSPGFRRVERPDKSWVSSKVTPGCGHLGGQLAASYHLLPPLAKLLGLAHRAELGLVEKKEERLPLFFPHRTTAGSIKSMTGGG